MKLRALLLTGIMVYAIGIRFVDHEWNFTPLLALAIFGGACFKNRLLAFALPMGAIVLSDILLGLKPENTFPYGGMAINYSAYALAALTGLWLRRRQQRWGPILGVSLLVSLQFFLISNFSAWVSGHSAYPMTFGGLMTAYAAGIPFFKGTFLGTMIYTPLFFGVKNLYEDWADSRERVAPVTIRA